MADKISYEAMAKSQKLTDFFSETSEE